MSFEIFISTYFQKLPEVLNLEKVDDDRTRLRRQLQAVSIYSMFIKLQL
jgi:hypothetical protein